MTEVKKMIPIVGIIISYRTRGSPVERLVHIEEVPRPIRGESTTLLSSSHLPRAPGNPKISSQVPELEKICGFWPSTQTQQPKWLLLVSKTCIWRFILSGNRTNSASRSVGPPVTKSLLKRLARSICFGFLSMMSNSGIFRTDRPSNFASNPMAEF